MYVPLLVLEGLRRYLEANPPDFKYDKIYFYFIIQKIALGILQKDKTERILNPDFVELNLSNLAKDSISTIWRYVKLLKEAEIIICDNTYIVGKKSLGYQINSKYLVGGYTKVDIPPKTKLYEKMIRRQMNKRAHDNLLPDYLKKMKKAFRAVDLDYEGAEKWILQNVCERKQICHLNALLRIQDDRFRYFKRNNTNQRVDSNITNLKSELRQFFIGEYISIDLKNSQLFLTSMVLSNLVKSSTYHKCTYLNRQKMVEVFGNKSINEILSLHKANKNNYEVSFKMFCKSAVDGDFYESFAQAYPKPIERDEVKKLMFSLLFSQNIRKNKKGIKIIPYRKKKEIFASIYPFVSKAVKTLKKKDHALLPIYLQKLESYVFIVCIARELVEAGIIPLTIHDAVLIKKEQKDETLRIIKDVFMKNFGVVPTFHITPLGTNCII
jgi:hypothetical protein